MDISSPFLQPLQTLASDIDLRHLGPCPGLNAAANHGYLEHSGVQTIESTVAGLGAAYNLAAPAAAFLAAYAIIFDGKEACITHCSQYLTNQR